MLYIILELTDGIIIKGQAIEMLKYTLLNNDGPLFITWDNELGHKMYEHNQIKTISVWVE